MKHYRVAFTRRNVKTNTEVHDKELVKAESTEKAEQFVKDKFSHAIITIEKTTEM